MIILEEVHLGETAKQDFDRTLSVITHLGETAKLIVVEVQQCQSEEHYLHGDNHYDVTRQ